jgi:hypothetical protein
MHSLLWFIAVNLANVMSIDFEPYERRGNLRMISISEKNYSDSCLSGLSNTNSSQFSGPARFLKYPDGTLHSVRIPYPGWTSARIMGDIVYILLTEVMGYSAVLIETPTIFDSHLVNFAAGCNNPDDETCAERDFERPIVHFTLETWDRGYKRNLAIPLDVRPVLLSVLSYDLIDEWYLWRDVVNAGWNSSAHLSLDHYRSYDASAFAPHAFFDPWTRVFELIPLDTIVRCSDMTAELGIDRATEQYTRATGDAGVQCSNNDTVWFAPACRANNATCVPLLLQYNVDIAMQIAAFLRMPLAIIMVGPGPAGDYEAYNRAVGARVHITHTHTDTHTDTHRHTQTQTQTHTDTHTHTHTHTHTPGAVGPVAFRVVSARRRFFGRGGPAAGAAGAAAARPHRLPRPHLQHRQRPGPPPPAPHPRLPLCAPRAGLARARRSGARLPASPGLPCIACFPCVARPASLASLPAAGRIVPGLPGPPGPPRAGAGWCSGALGAWGGWGLTAGHG